MEKQKCDKKLHNFMLLLLWSVAIIWGLGFVLTKILLDYLSPSMINIMRFGVSAVVLFCIYFKRIIHIKWKDIGYGALTSIFLILGFLVQTYGIDKTSPSNSALLTGLNVVMVPFLAWLFFKKRPPIKSFVSAILAVVSISLISFGGFSKINIGDFLCFLCTICFALHYIIISKTSKLVDAAVLAFLQMFFAAVAFTIIGFCFERDALLASNFNTTKIILPLIILCLLSTCYAYIVQTNAQKYVSPSQTSLILSTESLSGALFSVIMKMEPFTWYLGVAVILFAIALALSELPIKQYFMNFKQKRTKKAIPKDSFVNDNNSIQNCNMIINSDEPMSHDNENINENSSNTLVSDDIDNIQNNENKN